MGIGILFTAQIPKVYKERGSGRRLGESPLDPLEKKREHHHIGRMNDSRLQTTGRGETVRRHFSTRGKRGGKGIRLIHSSRESR